MQSWPPDDEHICSKHVEAWNKTYCEKKFLCIKLVNCWNKYTEMHGQQNVKKYASIHARVAQTVLFLSILQTTFYAGTPYT